MSVPMRSRDHATRITGMARRRCYLERMTRMRTKLLALLALGLAGCGPTAEELATTILAGLAVALLLGIVAVFALRRAWGDELSFPPWGIALGIVGLLGSVALMQSRHFDIELLGPALMAAGSATMGLSLLFGRMRLAAPAERSVVLTPVVVVGLLALPFAAVLMRFVSGSEVDPVMTAGLFALVGGFYASPVIVIGLVIERVVRARRAQRGYHADDAPG